MNVFLGAGLVPEPVAQKGRPVCTDGLLWNLDERMAYRMPCSTIDLATFMKPAMLAPFM